MNQSLKTCHCLPAAGSRLTGWLFVRKSAASLVLFTAATGGLANGADQPGLHRLKSAPSAMATSSSLKNREAAPRRSLAAIEKQPAFALASTPDDLFVAECDDAAGPAVAQALATIEVSGIAEPQRALPRRQRVTQVAAQFPSEEELAAELTPLPEEEPTLENKSPAEEEALRETPPAPATQLRPISAINPYHDYDPDGKRCEHQCPPDVECPADPALECPEEAPFYSATPPGRAFGPIQYCWTASNLYHRPLYFEDVGLERYGHVKRNEVVQQAWSLGKFGVQLVGLPYQIALDNPHDCRYALGYYQPGDCAPPMTYQAPLNGKAAIAAGAFYTGAAFIIP